MENLSQDIIKFIEKIVDKLRFEWEVTAIDKPDKVKQIS